MKYNIKKIQGNKMKFAKSVFMILLLVFIFMGYCGFTFDNKSFAWDNKDSNSSKKVKTGRNVQILRNEANQTRGRKKVWLDGTLGLGVSKSLVQGANDEIRYTDDVGNITLPLYSGNNAKYKLKGWYNIKTGDYYIPGQRVVLKEDTVLYADWMQADYNLKPNGEPLVGNQPDTGSFVRTDMFDYNEIFNAKHGAKALTGIDNHNEIWEDNKKWKGPDGREYESFLFTNWYNYNKTRPDLKTLGFPKNLTNNRNRYTDDLGGYTITKDIVDGHNHQIIKDLFTKNSVPGREYLGRGDKLFQYDENGTLTGSKFGKGYYFYDSDKNGADYNKAEQRFYVYKNRQFIQNQDSGQDRTPGFMPFEHGTVHELTGQTNYWFGMKTDVDFFLPDDVGSHGGKGNQSAAGKDMRFYFSGDDDVWIFVDGVKVLDLGGIHRRMSGDINFSTGEIRYENPETHALMNTDTTTLKKIKSGNHKLTIYYLERGSSKSNCSIYFNLAPRYSLEIDKFDAVDHSHKLKDAEFSIYADKNCTIPAQLWRNEEDCKANKPSQNVFKTGPDGKISCYGLSANRTYYIKETKAPSSYPSVADKIIRLKLDSAGNATLLDNDDMVTLASSSGNQKLQLHVMNKKPEKTSVEVLKKWYNEDGSEINGAVPKSVKVALYRSKTPNTGGGSGARVPINFTTQYFGDGNGSNTDTSQLSPGDYKFSTTATSGGGIEFTLETKGLNGKKNIGIYSVTANGHTIRPTEIHGWSEQNCYIGGRWGVYPYSKATYKIDPIVDGTDIKITLIGYLNHNHTGTPTVSQSLSMSVKETGNPQNPTETLPSDAVKVTDTGVENPVVLNKGNRWYKKWDNLPAKDKNGKPYYYYVKEEPVDGYSTSYTGNGVLNGIININNVRIRDIGIRKKWLHVNGTEMTPNERPDIPINAVLIQIDKTDNTTREIPVLLNKANNWSKSWRRDNEELAEKKGHKYKYKVREISQVEGYDTKYQNNGEIEEGEIAIVNQQRLYKLPAAGGIGTYIFNLAGALFITVALLMYITSRREKARSKRTR
ncbi:fibro-slime domain protein [Eubacterium nodatum ATCC 33099]|nr:fibro-slime domain protein [Eubacterium nodatum ATCC 33099]